MDTDSLPISLYLNRLVSTLVSPEFGASYNKSLVSALRSYVNGQLPEGSSAQLMEELKAHFTKYGSPDEWNTFSTILVSIPKQNDPNQITSYLQFLLNLVRDPNSHSTSPPIQARSSPVPFSSPFLPSNPQMHSLNGHPSSQPRSHDGHLDEDAVLSFLPNALVGLDNQTFRFTEDTVEILTPLTRGLSHLLHKLCEPALIYRRLHRAVEKLRGKNGSPIKAAFMQVLSAKLVAYASKVNRIMQASPSSILNVYNELQDLIVELRLLRHLYERLEDLDGFQFLEEIYKLASFGDTLVRNLAKDIYDEATKPYFQYLEHWITKGDLIDDSQEFFISFDGTADHINDIIRFHPERLPLFMGFSEAECSQILQIGKTIIFLNKFCKEYEWLNSFVKHYSAYMLHKHDGLIQLSPSTRKVLIQTQYGELLNYLTLVVYQKYDILEHLWNLKNIMLIGSNDFVESINERGLALFNEPATSLTSGKLASLLASAIAASSVRSLPKTFQLRIDARILDLSHGSIGWDVFTLEYKLTEPPLELLLNNNNQNTQYLRLFNFLWSIRHFLFLLNKNYVDYVRLQKNYLPKLEVKGGQAGGVRRGWFTNCLRTINVIRFRLLKFTSALLKYLSYDLIEVNFEEFILDQIFSRSIQQKLKTQASRKDRTLPILDDKFAAAFAYQISPAFSDIGRMQLAKTNVVEHTIDEITTMHLRYLKRIYDCKLINEQYKGKVSREPLIDQIFAFMEVLFAFIKSSEEFASSVVRYVNLLDLSRSVESDAGDAFENDLEQLHVHLASIINVMYKDQFQGEFQKRLSIFSKDLRADLDLKDLGKMI